MEMSMYVYIKNSEFLMFTTELSTVNQKILLAGPVGSEIYQQSFVKALAKYFNVKLIIFDADQMIYNQNQYQNSPPYQLLPPSSSSYGNSTGGIINFLHNNTQNNSQNNSNNSGNFQVGSQVTYLGKNTKLVNQSAKIVLSFVDNQDRFGICFDQEFAEGWNLGGLCEGNKGLMVNRSDIREHDTDFFILFFFSFFFF